MFGRPDTDAQVRDCARAAAATRRSARASALRALLERDVHAAPRTQGRRQLRHREASVQAAHAEALRDPHERELALDQRELAADTHPLPRTERDPRVLVSLLGLAGGEPIGI